MPDHEAARHLYDVMFKRKSVRCYLPREVPDDRLRDIVRLAQSCFCPTPEQPVAFRVLDRSQVRGIVSAKAPHFLALYAQPDDMSIVNAAFRLQQMDLWFSLNGLGSCWLGMPRPVPEHSVADGLPFVIMLAFGFPDEPLHRERRDEFKRKPIAEITTLDGMDDLLEPVRLAPSGTNRQPWYLLGTKRDIRLCARQNGAIASKIFGKMPMIDMGIALCHLWLSAEAAGLFEDFVTEVNCPGIPSGYRYFCTVRLRQP